ncbi:MAG TPA: DNA ligase D [Anaeromyxobacteraceae bacterium]|nr:DNA ligase D [Anaeromyxobacteraceae bacterium]
MGRHESDPLERYRSKRDASSTPEPFGSARPRASPEGGGLFVVQKHAATRLHYDFRLEYQGVLLSWAVPKGPSADPSEKRLAVRTEDHPVEYADFEGVIPEGNYGAGRVIVWDRGRFAWREDPAEGLRRGKLLLELEGQKLRGEWTLVKTRRGEKDWLLMKHRDRFAAKGIPFAEESVLSGRTLEDLAGPATAGARLEAELVGPGAPRRRLGAEDVKLMLAETSDEPFSGKEWVFELKYDGFRALAGKEGDRVEIRYRSGLDATALYPDLARALRAIPADRAVLDGEITVLDAEGKPSFQLLQQRALLKRTRDVERAARELPATYFSFDLLGLGERDLRSLPLSERKGILSRLVGRVGPVRYADHVEGQGEDFFRAVRAMGLEGMVAKRLDSTYRGGRSRAWVKVRVHRAADFVVVGFTDPARNRPGFGALHLALCEGGAYAYAGSVGTGFREEDLRAIRAELEPLGRRTPPATGPLPKGRGNHWVEPRLVAEVRYLERTREGLLRQPVFVRLRDDKSPEECVLAEPADPPAAAGRAGDPGGSDGAPERELRLSNQDKVFWPKDRYTKGDLLGYYREIADWVLPYLRDRPLTLTRYPDGIEGKSFFQKDAPAWTPRWVRTERVWSEDVKRDIDYFVVDDLETLLYVVNLGSIPLHVTSSRLSDMARPDWLVLDIDPKEAPFEHVVRIARRMHGLCEEAGLPCYPKTTGQRGMHVLVPLGRQITHGQAKELALILCRSVADEMPEIATLSRTIEARKGRVYLDWLQNGQGKTIVSPFSVRPRPGAPVSTPLSWSEVGPRLDPSRFTIETVPRRVERSGRDPMLPVLSEKPDLVAALGRLEAAMRAGA